MHNSGKYGGERFESLRGKVDTGRPEPGVLNLTQFCGFFFTFFLSQKKSSLTNTISLRNGICGLAVIFK
jgi:hypothetical protein